jgi:peptide/nickel transport system permease protein
MVSMLVFATTNILPGDAAAAILGKETTPAAIAQLRHTLGLDRPFYEIYLDWASGFAHGDFGKSFAAQAPVSSLLLDRLANTFVLMAVTILLTIPVALVLGAYAGIRSGRPADHILSLSASIIFAVPEFIVGTLLVLVFAVWLTILPAVSLPSGGSVLGDPATLVLPAVTLAAVSVAYAQRMIRAGVIEVKSSAYVEMARLNGIADRQITSRYILRNSLAPSVQVFALTLRYLVGGVIVVETVFGFPGIGQLLVTGVQTRDLPLVQSVAMLLALFVIAISVVADVVVILLVPKMRTEQ